MNEGWMADNVCLGLSILRSFLNIITDVDTSSSYHITESAATIFRSVQLQALAFELLKVSQCSPG